MYDAQLKKILAYVTVAIRRNIGVSEVETDKASNKGKETR
jgi:hypothetical protein